jgi:hypothetical protein
MALPKIAPGDFVAALRRPVRQCDLLHSYPLAAADIPYESGG